MARLIRRARVVALLSAALAAYGSSAAAAAARPLPVVWVQAGHAAPQEPGYRAQTGSGAGPFGAEVRFNRRVARTLVRRLRSSGVNARYTPGRVTPWGAGGDAFVSIHHDAPGGFARVGHAVFGAGENWYRGEGFGLPRSRPYTDSAPHRRATTVSRQVQTRSQRLAAAIARRLRTIHTRKNGARSRFAGVEPRSGNIRMMRYYGFYRTRADARVIVECGSAGTDDRYLAKVNLIASAVASGVLDDLRRRGRLRRAAAS